MAVQILLWVEIQSYTGWSFKQRQLVPCAPSSHGSWGGYGQLPPVLEEMCAGTAAWLHLWTVRL